LSAASSEEGSRPRITKSASTAPNPRLLIDTLGYLKLMCQRKAAAIAAALKTVVSIAFSWSIFGALASSDGSAARVLRSSDFFVLVLHGRHDIS